MHVLTTSSLYFKNLTINSEAGTLNVLLALAYASVINNNHK